MLKNDISSCMFLQQRHITKQKKILIKDTILFSLLKANALSQKCGSYTKLYVKDELIWWNVATATITFIAASDSRIPFSHINACICYNTIEIFNKIFVYMSTTQPRENWLRMTNFHFNDDFTVRAFISFMVYVLHFRALGK